MSNSAYRHAADHVPPPITRVADVMSTFRPRWFLCGGWAVDAWLGRQTRDHGDLDITVFEDDQRAVFEHLTGWRLVADYGSEAGDFSIDPWDGRRVDLPAHIHARPGDGFELEVQLNERARGEWVLRREPRIAVQLRRCVRPSPWGIPAAVPEVLLFYKATAYAGTRHYMRPRDHEDFHLLAPHLSQMQSAWLRNAISIVNAEHPWLSQLPP